jgi:acetyl-CoA carboxylase alpha subunit
LVALFRKGTKPLGYVVTVIFVQVAISVIGHGIVGSALAIGVEEKVRINMSIF